MKYIYIDVNSEDFYYKKYITRIKGRGLGFINFKEFHTFCVILETIEGHWAFQTNISYQIEHPVFIC